jgi:hypothetical protein
MYAKQTPYHQALYTLACLNAEHNRVLCFPINNARTSTLTELTFLQQLYQNLAAAENGPRPPRDVLCDLFKQLVSIIIEGKECFSMFWIADAKAEFIAESNRKLMTIGLPAAMIAELFRLRREFNQPCRIGLTNQRSISVLNAHYMRLKSSPRTLIYRSNLPLNVIHEREFGPKTLTVDDAKKFEHPLSLRRVFGFTSSNETSLRASLIYLFQHLLTLIP